MIEWGFAFLLMIRLSQPVIGVGLGVVLCLAACSSESDNVNSAENETAIESESAPVDAGGGSETDALPGTDDARRGDDASPSDDVDTDSGGANVVRDGSAPPGDSEALPLDCLDVAGGDAEVDDCGVCDADDSNNNES